MVGGAGLMQVFDPDLSEFSPIVSCLLGSFSTAPAPGTSEAGRLCLQAK